MLNYINVPFAEKDKAKSLGAKWDYDNQCWYVPEELNILYFQRWIGGYVLKDPPPKKRKPGQIDLIIGKTIIGSKYFDVEHDCIPWIICDKCQNRMKNRGLNG